MERERESEKEGEREISLSYPRDCAECCSASLSCYVESFDRVPHYEQQLQIKKEQVVKNTQVGQMIEVKNLNDNYILMATNKLHPLSSTYVYSAYYTNLYFN